MYEEVASLPLLKFAWTRSRVAFVLIHLFSLITIAVSDGNLWALGIIAGVQVIFWVGNYKHRERLRNYPTSRTNHVNEIVGEGTPNPVWKEGNKPILEFERWAAARYEKPYATAKDWLNSLPFQTVDGYITEFNAYLKRRGK